MNIVEEFIKRNSLGSSLLCFLSSSEFSEIENYIGVEFSRDFRKLINNLARVYNRPDPETGFYISCESINPGKFSPFGKGDRGSCNIGFPISELKNIKEYKEYTSILKSAGMNENLYPIFDEFEDSHSLICVSSNGKVYNYIYELDEDGYGSLLANSLDEFVNKLIL